jgi:hypothetical protein
MGVVGSLPSPPPAPPSPVDNKIEISHVYSLPSKEECSYCTSMTDEMDSTTDSSFISNINDDNLSNNHNISVPILSPPITTYNLLKGRVSVPTLATGRRSKFLPLEGAAAQKREARRHRNREAARKLKLKRRELEENLNTEISQLESKEKDLLLLIKNLESYKEELEVQSRNIISIQERLAVTASSTLKLIEHNRRRIHQNVPMRNNNNTDVKDEPRSPSPHWQLLFSI